MRSTLVEINLSLTDLAQWSCSCDIEVVFPGIAFDVLIDLARDTLLAGYNVEDKSSSGWGCVISRGQCWEGDRRELSTLIVEFISPLNSLILDARDHVSSTIIIRLGIYYDTFTLTLRFDRNALQSLNDACAELEISSYPSNL